MRTGKRNLQWKPTSGKGELYSFTITHVPTPGFEARTPYVIGMIDPETLHTTPERHIRCNPALAQFILDDRFRDIDAGQFAKEFLDPNFVRERESLVTRGWRRLLELRSIEELSILEYPLPEFRPR